MSPLPQLDQCAVLSPSPGDTEAGTILCLEIDTEADYQDFQSQSLRTPPSNALPWLSNYSYCWTESKESSKCHTSDSHGLLPDPILALWDSSMRRVEPEIGKHDGETAGFQHHIRFLIVHIWCLGGCPWHQVEHLCSLLEADHLEERLLCTVARGLLLLLINLLTWISRTSSTSFRATSDLGSGRPTSEDFFLVSFEYVIPNTRWGLGTGGVFLCTWWLQNLQRAPQKNDGFSW